MAVYVATTDGASDIGWKDALRVAMLSAGQPESGKYLLYAPEQFRGLFALTPEHVVLGKGMLMVDPTRESVLRLRKSCKKLDMAYPRSASSGHVLDVAKDTAEARRPAHINAQVTAALAMRAFSSSSVDQGQEYLAAPQEMCLGFGIISLFMFAPMTAQNVSASKASGPTRGHRSALHMQSLGPRVRPAYSGNMRGETAVLSLTADASRQAQGRS